MMEIILWLVIPGFLSLGVFFVWVFSLINQSNERYDHSQVLESLFANWQLNRSAQKRDILWYIGPPECPDGTFSPRQMALWRRFDELDTEDQEMTAQEREKLVNTITVIDDQIVFELENGINRY